MSAGFRRIAACLVFVLSFSPAAFAEGPAFSGTMESAVRVWRPASSAPVRYGFEEFANLRMSAIVGEYAKVYAAVNCRAVSLFDAPAEFSGEIERLYGAFRFDSADIEAGLFRLAFGFGQSLSGFRPTDLFSTGNPLNRSERPKGVLGGRLAWYPADFAKLQVFSVDALPHEAFAGAQRNLPVSGASAEAHLSAFSVQAVGFYNPPHAFGRNPLFRTGLSIKTDLVCTWTAEALVRFDDSNDSIADRSEAAFGADYSLSDGSILLFVQVFHSGARAVDLGTATLVWRQSDYTSWTAACTVSLGDLSALAYAVFTHEPFQGSTLSVSAELPLDGTVFGGSKRGKLGSETYGKDFSFALAAGFKF